MQENIYNRIVKKWKHRFKVDDEVCIRGTPNKGVIVAFRQFDEIIWEGLNPHWIDVKLKDGSIEVATARQIQK